MIKTKTLKKNLTNHIKSDIIDKLLYGAVKITERKFWKNFWKGVDKRIRMWYNRKAGLQKTGGHWKKFFEKTLRKSLTNDFESDIILKLLYESGGHEKKIWKNFWKGVDKWTWMWYNKKAHQQMRNSILKIKQCKESITTLEIPMRIGRSSKDFKTQ